MLYFCSSQIVVYSYSLKINELNSLKILYLYKTISTEVRIYMVSLSGWGKRKTILSSENSSNTVTTLHLCPAGNEYNKPATTMFMDHYKVHRHSYYL